MQKVEVREAILSDVHLLAPNLRAQDVNEIKAAYGNVSIPEAIEGTFLRSELRWAIVRCGRVVGLFGAAPFGFVLFPGAAPWLIGSPEIETFKVKFLRESRGYVAQMLDKYEYLENYVDVRNTVSVNWLKWLGFTMEEAKPWGVAGLPFHRFFKGGDGNVP